jgi:polyhydroxybutyrate depolymerase
MKKSLSIYILLVLVLFSCQLNQDSEINKWESGTYRLSVAHDRLNREYILYIPENYDEEKNYPLITVFHGGGGQAEEVVESNNWLAFADEQAFIAVFPDGSRTDMNSPASFTNNPQTWNDGSERSNIGAVERNVDDVGFINKMIAHLKDTIPNLSEDIFATGFSNGASMTFRMARENPALFEAVAPVAGTDWMSDFVPVSTPPRLLYITGTADPLNPFEGGNIFLGNTYAGTKPDVEEMIFNWTDLFDCEDQIVIQTQDGIKTYEFGCVTDNQLRMLALVGHGHHWPGARSSSFPNFLVGENITDLNANEVIWEFFEK